MRFSLLFLVVYLELSNMRKKLKCLISQRHSKEETTNKFSEEYNLPIANKNDLDKLETEVKTIPEVKESYVRLLTE
jgi:hypothetical protein